MEVLYKPGTCRFFAVGYDISEKILAFGGWDFPEIKVRRTDATDGSIE